MIRNCFRDLPPGQKQKEDLARVRAERSDLQTLAQQLARIVNVLEVENQQLKARNAALEQQVASHNNVTGLAIRRAARTDLGRN
ncbi:hypothetical protein QBB34_47540 [Streptomyces stelliscabiei]|uniref:hypothetical protein n=1 Tax=Streptomyces stelliscabiei TaxID=146820 RepID=UPI002FF0A05C